VYGLALIIRTTLRRFPCIFTFVDLLLPNSVRNIYYIAREDHADALFLDILYVLPFCSMGWNF